MKIAIIGASRGIGLATVSEALARGHQVTALSRKRGPLNDPKLHWIEGDARDPATLAKVLEGCDAAATTLGVTPSRKPITLFSESTKALLPALQSAGVSRLVAVTGIGAGDSRGHGGFLYDRLIFPLLLKTAYADKDVQERLIRDSGLDWTIVRPGMLKNGTKTGKVQAITAPSDYRGGSIRRADVAAFMLDCIEQKRFIHETPLIIAG